MAYAIGEKFIAEKSTSSQERISKDLAEANLTAEQLQSIKQVISVTQLRVKRKDGIEPKPEFQMPNLANATPGGLCDMLGDVREQIKDLQKLEGIYKEALEARIRAATEALEASK